MGTAIPFRREMDFDYGRLQPVAPGLRRIMAPNPSAFTLYGTGTFVVGEGEVAVIDPGPRDPAHVEALHRALAGRGERVAHILVTHTHSDHSPGAALLAALTGAPVYGYARHKAHRSLLAGVAETATEEEADLDFVPDRLLRDGDEVAGPGFRLTAVHTPGHIDNHLCFAWAETGALFSGDHVMGWATSVVVPPEGSMRAYMDSLAKVAARDDKVLYPTHGPPVDAPGPFVAAYIAHRREREAQVLEALAQGLDTVPAIVARLYAAVDPRLHGAAGMSVLAHLIHLHEDGRVAADGPPSLRARWRL